MNAIQTMGPTSPVPTVTGTLDIVRAALATGNVEMYREAVALAKELDAIAARKAFDNGMADVRAELKPVVRNATGHNSKKYADFAAIARMVDPILAKHGFNYRFRTVQTEKTVSVTCILSHRAGHFEECTLTGPIDTTGNKNPIQAIGSSLSYLQRYSLVQSVGLAAADDDDGHASAAAPERAAPPADSVTEEQEMFLRDALEEKGASEKAFLQFAAGKGWFKDREQRLSHLPAQHYPTAVNAISGFKRS